VIGASWPALSVLPSYSTGVVYVARVDGGPAEGFPTEAIRLGFVLARPDEWLSWLPARRYRGLDDEPHVPFILQLPTSEADVWNGILEAVDE
jgi:hypothetical protein